MSNGPRASATDASRGPRPRIATRLDRDGATVVVDLRVMSGSIGLPGGPVYGATKGTPAWLASTS